MLTLETANILKFFNLSKCVVIISKIAFGGQVLKNNFSAWKKQASLLKMWRYKWIIKMTLVVKKICLPMQETEETSLVGEDALEEGRATHSSILAWRSP